VRGTRRASFEGFLKDAGGRTDGIFEGAIETHVRLVEWHVPSESSKGVPNKQTLERLVCTAIDRAFPGRGHAIDAWLASRPSPPSDEKAHKAHAASHMAGWFSDRGYEGLFEAVWQDAKIREELESLLLDSGEAFAWITNTG
jgi:hypothetical protein